MITDSTDWRNAYGTMKGFHEQWETETPKLGETYRITGCGVVTKYVKIISIVETVAIGKVVWDTLGCRYSGEFIMYHLNGCKAGWQYNEPRPEYRLKNL